ncbi:methyl-accepting chemotaxis protein [Massilia solisilvae]|uniref:methyl-accepting chemotaxis protein n=1 Tax=Massilia solisilvae TaxID=1811225 RepID=UPI0027D9442A|nr:methyl-accepting chemotaxis protein [Massilia solisilvae]
MNMNALKVGTRLVIGFGCLSLLLVMIIAVGVNKASTLNAASAQIAQQELPKLEQSSILLAQVDRIAIALRNMMLNPEPQDRKKQLDTIEEARGTANAQLDLLRAELVAPDGRALVQTAQEARARYRAGQDALIALIQGGKDDEAKTYLATQLRPALANYKGTVEKLIAHATGRIDAASRDAAATYATSRNTMLGLGALALALAAIIGATISRSLLKQLGGEPDYAAQVAGEIAAGNLTVRVDLKANDESSLLAAMQDMRRQLEGVVRQVRTGTDTINTAAGEIAAGNYELSARTEHQASALEETASSLEELTSTVRQNADNARQANQLALSASEVAQQGGAVVSQAVERMASINAASRNIVEIISVIDGIAFQTNILALNAAVEAARAGEQGRGFAVVAAEVRTLAQRSAAAAKEIKTLIDHSVAQVDSGARLVDQAGATMKDIIESVRRVTDIMGEITAASSEQSAGLEQINKAVVQMDQVTQQNAALVEEAAAASASMQEQAASLARTVGVFQLDQLAIAAPSRSRLALA